MIWENKTRNKRTSTCELSQKSKEVVSRTQVKKIHIFEIAGRKLSEIFHDCVLAMADIATDKPKTKI